MYVVSHFNSKGSSDISCQKPRLGPQLFSFRLPPIDVSIATLIIISIIPPCCSDNVGMAGLSTMYSLQIQSTYRYMYTSGEGSLKGGNSLVEVSRLVELVYKCLGTNVNIRWTWTELPDDS